MLLYAGALEIILTPDFTGQVPKELLQQLPHPPDLMLHGLLNIIFNGIMV